MKGFTCKLWLSRRGFSVLVGLLLPEAQVNDPEKANARMKNSEHQSQRKTSESFHPAQTHWVEHLASWGPLLRRNRIHWSEEGAFQSPFHGQCILIVLWLWDRMALSPCIAHGALFSFCITQVDTFLFHHEHLNKLGVKTNTKETKDLYRPLTTT